MIRFKCACGKHLKAGEQHAGKITRCPRCSRAVSVPQTPADEQEDKECDWGSSAEIDALSEADCALKSEPGPSPAEDGRTRLPPVLSTTQMCSVRPPVPDEREGVAWYYSPDGTRQEGPVAEEQIFRLLSEGVLGRSAMVWNEGWAAWRFVAEFARLSEDPVAPAAVHAAAQDAGPGAVHAAPPVAEPGWYLSSKGSQPAGPYTQAQIDLFLAQGSLAPDSLCWRDGWPFWIKLQEVPGMRDRFAFAVPKARAASPGAPPSSRRRKMRGGRTRSGLGASAVAVLAVLVLAALAKVYMGRLEPTSSAPASRPPTASAPEDEKPEGRAVEESAAERDAFVWLVRGSDRIVAHYEALRSLLAPSDTPECILVRVLERADALDLCVLFPRYEREEIDKDLRDLESKCRPREGDRSGTVDALLAARVGLAAEEAIEGHFAHRGDSSDETMETYAGAVRLELQTARVARESFQSSLETDIEARGPLSAYLLYFLYRLTLVHRTWAGLRRLGIVESDVHRALGTDQPYRAFIRRPSLPVVDPVGHEVTDPPVRPGEVEPEVPLALGVPDLLERIEGRSREKLKKLAEGLAGKSLTGTGTLLRAQPSSDGVGAQEVTVLVSGGTDGLSVTLSGPPIVPADAKVAGGLSSGAQVYFIAQILTASVSPDGTPTSGLTLGVRFVKFFSGG
ncbi:MAG: DUF4339 domain-containing protein [Planctomycetes bacterium]|nr:DUF4339 domain-containing protein [Planctomycetota bacterium]